MIFKKGAMFGLDARIALAIFGALSVISGAALYSAIQESKITQILADSEEVIKAWEQYYLDTGNTLPKLHPTAANNTAQFYELLTSDLVLNSKNVSNWKGPYLSNEKIANSLKPGSYAHQLNLVMLTKSDPSWGGGDESTAWWNMNSSYCTTGKQCHLWLQVAVISPSLVNALDKKIDNGDGGANGSIKWFNHSTGLQLFMRKNAITNPND